MTKDDKYTDPELRSEIKERVQASDKGGKPGQWSARKAQMMATEYKKEMHERGEEPYTTGKSDQSESQKHLNKWTKEDWQTSDGNGVAKQQDGTEQRYLPKKAWEKMSEEEIRETNEKKLAGSKESRQYVENTDTAKKARRDASDGTEEAGTRETTENRGEGRNDVKRKRSGEDDGSQHQVHGASQKKRCFSENSEVSTEKTRNSTNDQGNAKEDTDERGLNEQKEDNRENCDRKDYGDPGNGKRLPKEGQIVHWKVARNWTKGIVIEILWTDKVVSGIHAKATQEDPRIAVKSSKSGKEAIHKPDAVYF